MNKLRIKKWVKYLIASILTIIIAIMLTHLICKNLLDIEKIADQCDYEYGYTCSYYELQNYVQKGEKYGR